MFIAMVLVRSVLFKNYFLSTKNKGIAFLQLNTNYADMGNFESLNFRMILSKQYYYMNTFACINFPMLNF